MDHARLAGWKVCQLCSIYELCLLFITVVSNKQLYGMQCNAMQGLRLHLDYSGTEQWRRRGGSGSVEYAQADAWASAYSAVAAGAALVAGLGLMAYLKKAGQ